MVRALGLGLAPSPAARLLRHFDRRGMLGPLLVVVGTIAMSAYEVEAGARIFSGFDATQDFDLAWRGLDALQLQTIAPVSLLGPLREVDPLFTRNTGRAFQAVSGKYEVEILAAPSTWASFPKGDLVPIPGMAEQEWLLLGTPLRHVIGAVDGTPAAVVAPDPRWMSLHKLWLSQKPQRQATKKPKDQAQGLLLMRAVIECMPAYPLDEAFISAVPAELKAYLRMGVDWALANRSVPAGDVAGDEFNALAPARIAPGLLRRIRRVAAAVPAFETAYDAGG